jgi:catalase-peroxidase
MSLLGPTTVGLIYVNPGGPVGVGPDPVASGEDIRQAFARMVRIPKNIEQAGSSIAENLTVAICFPFKGFDDRTSVSLIGGGHAFGKNHGACAAAPCGEGAEQGIGVITFTSGFEGAWTTQPTTWTNEFFTNLFDFTWTLGESTAGNPQWFPEGGPSIVMLTTDIALRDDPVYNPITREFANNITALEDAFADSWYRLMTGDMGSRERCLNDDAPESQPWQYGLSAAPATLPDFVPIRKAFQAKIDADNSSLGAFVKLAMGCANTFRETDYRGGCNGARIRFVPEINWSSNEGAAATLTMIEAVKAKYPDASYADLIVLAGQTALEAVGLPAVDFCCGRFDAEDAVGSAILVSWLAK